MWNKKNKKTNNKVIHSILCHILNPTFPNDKSIIEWSIKAMLVASVYDLWLVWRLHWSPWKFCLSCCRIWMNSPAVLPGKTRLGKVNVGPKPAHHSLAIWVRQMWLCVLLIRFKGSWTVRHTLVAQRSQTLRLSQKLSTRNQSEPRLYNTNCISEGVLSKSSPWIGCQCTKSNSHSKGKWKSNDFET